MRSTKKFVAGGLVLIILAVAAGVVWYLSVPHSAGQQFARAQKLETALRADAQVKSPEQVKPELDQTIELYHKVALWNNAAKTLEALRRIESLQEEVAKSDTDALKTLDEIIKGFPGEDSAGQALLDQERLIRKDADNLKAAKPEDAAPAYKDALAKLDEYLAKFPHGKLADLATMEKGRIWQDGLGDPLINAINIFEKFIKDYPASDFMPEALYRLGRLYQFAGQYDRAMACYGELTEKYPKSTWAQQALLEKGKILAQAMDKQKEAEKDFQEFEKKYPDSPLRPEAQAGEKTAHDKVQAGEAQEKYGKSRYGGTIPYDTTADKPIPPAGLFRLFAEQKLHAQKYVLDVTFAPADHRITVKGTLNLVNHGADKTQLLLQLPQAMHVQVCTINGLTVRQDLVGQKWTISLPAPLKEGPAPCSVLNIPASLPRPCRNSGRSMQRKRQQPSLQPSRQPNRPPPRTSSTLKKPVTRRPRPRQPNGCIILDPQLALVMMASASPAARGIPSPSSAICSTPTSPSTPRPVSKPSPMGRSKSANPDTGEFVFHTEHPIFGLYFAYGKYNVHKQTIGKITYYTYLLDRNVSKSDAYIKVASNILNYYSDKFVPFPYEKFAIIEVPLPPFLGGVGPASMMFLNESMVAFKDPPEFLLAHELAHQWFGNLIPINMTDPGYNQWLSEGFATYCDALYEEKDSGPEAMARHMQKYGQLFFQMSLMYPQVQQAIKNCYPMSPLYRPVVYEKGRPGAPRLAQGAWR